MIQPIYVTFEQAKLLKEKGFDVECLYHYGITNSFLSIGSDIPATNWNKKIEDHMEEVELYSRPEHWQVVEWLASKGIEVSAQINFYNKQPKLGYYYTIDRFNEAGVHDGKNYDDTQIQLIGEKEGFKTRQEAYSAAFDHVLNNIL